MKEGRKKTNCSHYRTNKNQYFSKQRGGGCGLEGHCSYCIGVDFVGIKSGGEGAVEPITFEC